MLVKKKMDTKKVSILFVYHRPDLPEEVKRKLFELIEQEDMVIHCDVFIAVAIDEATRLFAEHQSPIVVVGPDVGGSVFDSLGFLRRISPGHTGVRIAWTGIESCLRKLREAGCNQECVIMARLPQVLFDMIKGLLVTPTS
jgi:hypothetical protein